MHTVILADLLAKAATTKKASGSPASLIFIVLIVVAVYFLFLRPRSRRAKQQQQSSGTLSVGDEVISAGGILGRVTNIVGDEIEVEVAPGTTLTFWRRAINLRSAVRGAPQSAPVDDAPPPGGHYGIDDRYDDGADGSGPHLATEDEDGYLYGVERADEPSETGGLTPPEPYLEPTAGEAAGEPPGTGDQPGPAGEER